MSIFGFEGRRIPLVEEELGGAASSSWPRAGRQESVSPGEQNSMRPKTEQYEIKTEQHEIKNRTV